MATPALETTPAGMPPPGVVPNFAHPQSLAKAFFAEGSVLLFIMLLFLCFRIYAKTRILQKASWDDLTCALAAMGTIYYYVVVCVAITVGKIGVHIWDVTLAFLTSDSFLIPAYLVDAWPTLTFLLTKLTFMLLYLQIFRPMRWLRFGCYLGIIVMTLVYVSIWIAQVYITTPEHGQSWLENFETPRNRKAMDLAIPLTALSLVFDVYIFVLPIAGVIRLQMSFRRKLEIIAMFISGLAAVIASALSLVFRVKASSVDFTYSSFPVQVTAFTEMAVGVSVSCMPTTSIFFRHLKGTPSGTDGTAHQRMLTREADLTSNQARYKRGLGFSSRTWRSLDGSQNGLTHETALELQNSRSIQTVVGGGSPPPELPGDRIQYSTRIEAHSESRE